MTIRSYIYDMLNAMAKGLFATLVMGTIVRQIGLIAGVAVLEQLGQAAMFFMGPAIGSAVAIGRGAKTFTILAAMVAGAIGAGTVVASGGSFMVITGEPVGALLAAIVAVEFGRLVEGRSRFDLLLVPAVVIISGGLVGVTIAPYIAAAMTSVGAFINNLTLLQ
ncbi:MAG: PTS sugar transporter subunit IIC, partial [Defluviitaleaceae bacterium]|nr:PTS sugar transporter subunit IIC [Defluviitaleaceae bacterium]